MGSWELRVAREEDAAEVAAIYRPYVLQTAVTFEYEPPSEAEFRERIRTALERYPFLVCTADGRTAGYAYAHEQRARSAYQWNAELSVYIGRDYIGQRLGRRLYRALEELLKRQGFQNLYGCVTLPNRGSERLHQELGYQTVGIYAHTGYKHHQWHDTAVYWKQIGWETEPKPVIPFSQLECTEFIAGL